MDEDFLNKRIFKVFGQDENFDKISFNLKRANEIFSQMPGFNKLDDEDKYNILSTAVIMAIATGNDSIRKIRILFPVKEASDIIKQWSVDYGYKEPDFINLPNQKLLK